MPRYFSDDFLRRLRNDISWPSLLEQLGWPHKQRHGQLAFLCPRCQEYRLRGQSAYESGPLLLLPEELQSHRVHHGRAAMRLRRRRALPGATPPRQPVASRGTLIQPHLPLTTRAAPSSARVLLRGSTNSLGCRLFPTCRLSILRQSRPKSCSRPQAVQLAATGSRGSRSCGRKWIILCPIVAFIDVSVLTAWLLVFIGYTWPW